MTNLTENDKKSIVYILNILLKLRIRVKHVLGNDRAHNFNLIHHIDGLRGKLKEVLDS